MVPYNNDVFKLSYYDFMTDDYHADSYKDYNPYYKIISRPAKKWYDKGKKINRTLFGSKKNYMLNILY